MNHSVCWAWCHRIRQQRSRPWRHLGVFCVAGQIPVISSTRPPAATAAAACEPTQGRQSSDVNVNINNIVRVRTSRHAAPIQHHLKFGASSWSVSCWWRNTSAGLPAYVIITLTSETHAFSVERQPPVWWRLSSSVNLTIAIPYWPGCRNRACGHCNWCCSGALGPCDLVTSTLHDLHLLPLEQSIIFKLCSLMHLVIRYTVLNIYENLSRWHPILLLIPDSALLAADAMRRQRLVWRSFAAALNSLPASLRDICDHQAFKTFLNLKTELFNRVHTTWDCFVCHALMVTYGVYGAIEKCELELVL